MAEKKTKTVVTKKKKRNNIADITLNTTQNPNEISEMMGHLLHHYGRPPVMSDEEAQQRIADYFVYCAEHGTRPIWEELCMALGVNRSTVMRWEKKEVLPHTNRSEIISQAKTFMAAFDAKAVSENKMNPVTYIFRSKNFYGMTDTQEHILTPNQPLGDVQTPDMIEAAIESDLIE